jgi:hypothetical protein
LIIEASLASAEVSAGAVAKADQQIIVTMHASNASLNFGSK